VKLVSYGVRQQNITPKKNKEKKSEERRTEMVDYEEKNNKNRHLFL